jgi:hypothetical protein
VDCVQLDQDRVLQCIFCGKKVLKDMFNDFLEEGSII